MELKNMKQRPIIYVEDPEKADQSQIYNFQDDDVNHIILDGVTRQGKSSTLRVYVLNFIRKGFTVVWREVGKFDIISRFQCVQDVIDYYERYYGFENEYGEWVIPSDKEEILDFWYWYQREKGNELVVCIDHPDKIQVGKINVLTFDVMDGISNNRGNVITQYFYFMQIYKIFRETHWENYDLVFFIDEANYIMPGRGKYTPPKHIKPMIQDMVSWMTQWAGYHVKFLLSTHKSYELNDDAKSQCSLMMFKRAIRKDAKELMMYELDYLDDDNFIETYNKIKVIPKDTMLYIDNERRYTFLKIPFHPRKYTVKACIEFIDQFDCKPIVRAISRTNKEVKKINDFLYEKITDKIMDKIFIPKRDKETQIAKVIFNQPQFLSYFFEFEEFKDLYEDDWFIQRRIIPNFITHYENKFLTQKLAEREKELKENKNNDEELNKLIYSINELHKQKISNRQIAKILHVYREKVDKIVQEYCT